MFGVCVIQLLDIIAMCCKIWLRIWIMTNDKASIKFKISNELFAMVKPQEKRQTMNTENWTHTKH